MEKKGPTLHANKRRPLPREGEAEHTTAVLVSPLTLTSQIPPLFRAFKPLLQLTPTAVLQDAVLALWEGATRISKSLFRHTPSVPSLQLSTALLCYADSTLHVAVAPTQRILSPSLSQSTFQLLAIEGGAVIET